MDTLARLERLETHLVELMESLDQHVFILSLAALAQANPSVGDLTLAYERSAMLRQTRHTLEHRGPEGGKA